MRIRSFLAGKAVDPEIISEMADALQSVCKALSYLKPAPNDFLERRPVSKRVDIPALLIERWSWRQLRQEDGSHLLAHIRNSVFESVARWTLLCSSNACNASCMNFV